MTRPDHTLRLQIFLEITVSPATKEDNYVTAILSNIHGNVWRHYLGNVGYYKYLNDLFDDLSFKSRVGEVSFYKRAYEDPCAHWTIKQNVEYRNFLEQLKLTVRGINMDNTKYFLGRYGVLNNVNLVIPENDDPENDEGPVVLISVECQLAGIINKRKVRPVRRKEVVLS